MAKIYRVQSAEEALQLALHFREEGKYDLFRGQAQNWPLVCSMNRLSLKKRKEEIEKLKRFHLFLSRQIVTHKYINNFDWYYAVAQHYGIGTSFIDFTKNPEVALFFATNSRCNESGKESVIICMNKNDFTECVNMCKTIFAKNQVHPPSIIDIEVDNLWRLETQEGCFLDCIIQNLEEAFYPFDKIIFPFEKSYTGIDISHIYPKSKSELEILLDQFFAGEHLLYKEIRYKKMIKKYFPEIKATKIQDSPTYKYTKTRKQHYSWKKNLIKHWHYKATAEYEKSIPLKISIVRDIMDSPDSNWNAIFNSINKCFKSYAVERSNSISLEIEYLQKKDNYMNRVVSKNIVNIWDGMRTLPYTYNQIIATISKYIYLELSSFKVKEEEHLFPNSIYISMSSKYGIYNRCYVDQSKIEEAIRSDISNILVNRISNLTSSLILLYINKPHVVFDFNRLTFLFADELIPAQMFLEGKNSHPVVFYSPIDIDVLGYA